MPALFSTGSLAIDLAKRAPNTTGNYAELLDAHQIHYRSNEYYWQVGDLNTAGDWILNLSVIKSQISNLLDLIIPLLIQKNIPFRIIRDESIAHSALDGHLGPKYLGKIVSIYPSNAQDALALAKDLITLTRHYKGPAIRTDRCLGGIVYTSLKTHSTIPFSIPPNTIWPFQEIVDLYTPPKPKLLNFSYYPTSIIKADAKGDVIKALYFKKFWSIKLCIIKQGRANMFMDAESRDIRDRLHWQYELHAQLADELPIPKIFDHFMIDSDSYLVMQFINGVSFTTYLNKLYNNRVWYDLPAFEKIKIIDHLLNILDIIQRLHVKGYVHRDITPDNFLLDKNNKIWLIDVELMWSINAALPAPPFGLGTPGFISPEQQRTKPPTVKEDIYAVGGLMIAFFTNLAPIKFQGEAGEIVKQKINFFIKSGPISSMISDCLDILPTERPSLLSILKCLQSYRDQIFHSEKHMTPHEAKTKDERIHQDLRKNVQIALNGLTSPLTLDHKNRWISPMPSESKAIGNEQLGKTVEQGWYRGVAGPLWLLAVAHRHGFDVSNAMTAYNANWSYIQKEYYSGNSPDKTLYMGGAGIALALTEGLNSGLLPADSHHIEYLRNCFSQNAQLPTLAEGIAGQGIALLYASGWLEPVLLKELLSLYVDQLVITQRSDGAWPLPSVAAIGKSVFALNHGIAGIIWFLLAYLQYNPELAIKTTTIKGLNYLTKKVHKKGRLHIWPDLNAEHQWSMEKGAPGIALVLIKAYQILEMDLYRNLAEGILYNIPERPVITNFTLGSGLAGIGQLYLEAFNVFQDEIWQSRVEWVKDLLIHTLCFEPQNKGYWVPDYHSSYTADLFMGNSGVTHFLMRCTLPQTLPHPLNPFYKL